MWNSIHFLKISVKKSHYPLFRVIKLQFKKIAPSRFFDVFENSILMLFRIYVPLCTLLNNATYALKIAFHRKERNAQRIGVPVKQSRASGEG